MIFLLYLWVFSVSITALNVLNEIKTSQDANEVNKSDESTWFMKIGKLIYGHSKL